MATLYTEIVMDTRYRRLQGKSAGSLVELLIMQELTHASTALWCTHAIIDVC